MECFAAYLSYTDAQIGRVLEYLEESGDLDNTLIVLCSDNGASVRAACEGSINDVRMYNGASTGRKELRARIDEIGGPTTHNNYPWGWTMAGNTPFKRWKREVHEGGVADPCIIRCPAQSTDRGGAVRRQFAHAVDVLPDRARAGRHRRARDARRHPAVADRRHELRSPRCATPARPRRHETQYFEMLGSRGIYHRGWKAVTFHPLGRDVRRRARSRRAVRRRRVGALRRRAPTPSETNDLAAQEPERLAAMVDLWWDEARRNDVLPLDNRPLVRDPEPAPAHAARTRTTLRVLPGRRARAASRSR